MLRLRMSYATPPLPYMHSKHGQEELYLYLLIYNAVPETEPCSKIYCTTPPTNRFSYHPLVLQVVRLGFCYQWTTQHRCRFHKKKQKNCRIHKNFKVPKQIPNTQHITGNLSSNWKKLNNFFKLTTVFFFPSTGKATPLQALTGPEGSRRVRLPDFKTIST
jgi:hypothetical protein